MNSNQKRKLFPEIVAEARAKHPELAGVTDDQLEQTSLILTSVIVSIAMEPDFIRFAGSGPSALIAYVQNMAFTAFVPGFIKSGVLDPVKAEAFVDEAIGLSEKGESRDDIAGKLWN